MTLRRDCATEVEVKTPASGGDGAGNYFTKPLQDLVTEYCWGAVWGRDGLALKTRSMLNLAMIAALNRPHELRTHIKAALTNGVTRDEIREIGPSHLAEQRGYPRVVQSSAASHDERLQRWLWAVSEQSTGVTYPV